MIRIRSHRSERIASNVGFLRIDCEYDELARNYHLSYDAIDSEAPRFRESTVARTPKRAPAKRAAADRETKTGRLRGERAKICI